MATEMRVLKKVHHRNLVGLQGSCLGEYHLLLVFDYFENGSLDTRLRDPAQVPLTWAQRVKIARGSAEGLKYLHEFCRPPIIHRDVKAANILLDNDLEAQVADFGLAKLIPEGANNMPFEVTAILGTTGYVAPEYLQTGSVDEKIDVYAFGVVLFELITGQLPVSERREPRLLVGWPIAVAEEFERLADPRLGGEYDAVQLASMAQIACTCCELAPEERPSMGEVVRWLENLSS
eukprot:jgi/Mesen1/8422/ME000472S07779